MTATVAPPPKRRPRRNFFLRGHSCLFLLEFGLRLGLALVGTIELGGLVAQVAVPDVALVGHAQGLVGDLRERALVGVDGDLLVEDGADDDVAREVGGGVDLQALDGADIALEREIRLGGLGGSFFGGGLFNGGFFGGNFFGNSFFGSSLGGGSFLSSFLSSFFGDFFGGLGGLGDGFFSGLDGGFDGALGDREHAQDERQREQQSDHGLLHGIYPPCKSNAILSLQNGSFNARRR